MNNSSQHKHDKETQKVKNLILTHYVKLEILVPIKICTCVVMLKNHIN